MVVLCPWCMGWWGWGWGPWFGFGWWIFGALLFILFMALLVLLIVWLIRALSRSGHENMGGRGSPPCHLVRIGH